MQYKLVNLRPVNTGEIRIRAVNSEGMVALTYTQHAMSDNYHSGIWHHDTLTYFPQSPSYQIASHVTGINDYGIAVGLLGDEGSTDGTSYKAVVWDFPTGMRILPTPWFEKRSRAKAINNTGLIVGDVASQTRQSIPILWDAGLPMSLPCLNEHGSALDINNAGMTAGFCWENDSQRACVWMENERRDIELPQAKLSRAIAVNDSGVALVHMSEEASQESYNESTSGMHSLLWRPDNSIETITTPRRLERLQKRRTDNGLVGSIGLTRNGVVLLSVFGSPVLYLADELVFLTELVDTSRITKIINVQISSNGLIAGVGTVDNQQQLFLLDVAAD